MVFNYDFKGNRVNEIKIPKFVAGENLKYFLQPRMRRDNMHKFKSILLDFKKYSKQQ